ncbi:RDD family protein [Flavitalea sp.]|nr:RDD family protein [Flavitalea sp.]
MQTQYEQPTQDILTPEDYRTRADTGKRFLNYLIDVLAFYALIIVVGMFLALSSPAIAESLAETDTDNFALIDNLFTLVLYGLYMSAVEAIFKGKSLGKLITKTRAVNLDGSRISTSTAFARGFSRAVPFCVFSAFGSPCNPWQDKWTNTIVIDEK